MRKMSFRVTGSDAVRLSHPGKVERNTDSDVAARFGYFVRIIVEDVSLPLALYLSCAFSRDTSPGRQKAPERREEKLGRERRLRARRRRIWTEH